MNFDESSLSNTHSSGFTVVSMVWCGERGGSLGGSGGEIVEGRGLYTTSHTTHTHYFSSACSHIPCMWAEIKLNASLFYSRVCHVFVFVFLRWLSSALIGPVKIASSCDCGLWTHGCSNPICGSKDLVIQQTHWRHWGSNDGSVTVTRVRISACEHLLTQHRNKNKQEKVDKTEEARLKVCYWGVLSWPLNKI